MSDIPAKVVKEMLNAAGNRRDALMHVLYKHGLIKEPENVAESAGPNAQVEGADAPIEDDEAEETVSTEAEEA